MITANRIPSSQPGQLMCELRVDSNRLQRTVCRNAAEAQRLCRMGASVWIGRSGGWVKQV